jgi:hypothetical protein
MIIEINGITYGYPLVKVYIATENGLLKYMVYLFKMLIFYSYVSLPGGKFTFVLSKIHVSSLGIIDPCSFGQPL